MSRHCALGGGGDGGTGVIALEGRVWLQGRSLSSSTSSSSSWWCCCCCCCRSHCFFSCLFWKDLDVCSKCIFVHHLFNTWYHAKCKNSLRLQPLRSCFHLLHGHSHFTAAILHLSCHDLSEPDLQSVARSTLCKCPCRGFIAVECSCIQIAFGDSVDWWASP